MSPPRPRWWRRRPSARPFAQTPATVESLDCVDDQLALVTRLLRDARERGHHNEAEKLRRWIDQLLDKRSSLGSR
ncbi:hypothetical protein [Streptacidiphilus sp. MAP5-52]|uniref:hypothetical protein n=1 Tax=Streptacidiphilus sp. MAP5-52 TaxID=3156267 RepID=UPI003518BF6B